ncbi:MAG: MFS transporter [Actinomycetota bacterium]|nr:MFS transporter [Actinomycetota bacterium]
MATALPHGSGRARPPRPVYRAARRAASYGKRRLTVRLGGPDRTRVIVVLAAVLAMASADTATVGASATSLRADLHISNTDVGLLVAVTSLVGAIGAVPYGMLADRVNRTRTLTMSVIFWGVAMVGSATAGSFSELLLWRMALGLVTAAAGPPVASLVGDYFPSTERGVVYSYILSGELLGAGVGFTVTGDISALSWRAAFIILGLATFPLGWVLARLPEPDRGGANPIVAVAPDDPAAFSGAGPPSPPPRSPSSPPPPPPPRRSEPAGTQTTDAQRLAAEAGILPDEDILRLARTRRMGLVASSRFVLSVRTNVALILSSAFGYYFLAGVQTFGVEFVRGRYHVGVALANLLMIAIGSGAVIGVVAAGPVSDALLHKGHIKARVQVPGVAAALTVVLFIPALLTRSMLTALPYVILAAMALSAQNPPIDAARLDIMPFRFWGRAEGVRTLLRTLAQSLAPLLFGSLSDLIGLRDTFMIMLAPLAASAWFLFRATRTYPTDVATAVAASELFTPDPDPRPRRR